MRRRRGATVSGSSPAWSASRIPLASYGSSGRSRNGTEVEPPCRPSHEVQLGGPGRPVAPLTRSSRVPPPSRPPRRRYGAERNAEAPRLAERGECWTSPEPTRAQVLQRQSYEPFPRRPPDAGPKRQGGAQAGASPALELPGSGSQRHSPRGTGPCNTSLMRRTGRSGFRPDGDSGGPASARRNGAWCRRAPAGPRLGRSTEPDSRRSCGLRSLLVPRSTTRTRGRPVRERGSPLPSGFALPGNSSLPRAPPVRPGESSPAKSRFEAEARRRR